MLETVAEVLINWYTRAGRNLPWRTTQDPYRVWLAETILQQTRVAQGLVYYDRFLERFPTLTALAQAPLDDVLKAWEGLGYYSRARNLHKAAQLVANELKGEFPQTHTDWGKLPGVGPYTARAVAAFAYGEQVAVLDGNVFRVISRVEGDAHPIDRADSRRRYQARADAWLADADPRVFNNALMDFGATVCTPRQPSCPTCPLATHCRARKEGRVLELPVKEKRLLRKQRYFDFFWYAKNGRVWVRQRDAETYWQHLWELPNREVDDFSAPPELGRMLGTLSHEFSHFRMNIRLLAVEALPQALAANGTWHPVAEESARAFPKAVHKLFALARQPNATLDFSAGDNTAL